MSSIELKRKSFYHCQGRWFKCVALVYIKVDRRHIIHSQQAGQTALVLPSHEIILANVHNTVFRVKYERGRNKGNVILCLILA